MSKKRPKKEWYDGLDHEQRLMVLAVATLETIVEKIEKGRFRAREETFNRFRDQVGEQLTKLKAAVQDRPSEDGGQGGRGRRAPRPRER